VTTRRDHPVSIAGEANGSLIQTCSRSNIDSGMAGFVLFFQNGYGWICAVLPKLEQSPLLLDGVTHVLCMLKPTVHDAQT
jgi:ketopantoate reductase